MTRNLALELLRGMAAFGIIGCHLSLSPMTDGAQALNLFCDMNVCLFASISGWCLAESEFRRSTNDESIVSYALRRAKRLLPIYAFWSMAFLLLGVLFDIFVQHQINPRLQTGRFYLEVLLMGNAATHLWFLICLFYAQVLLKLITGTTRLRNGWFWLAAGLLVMTWASQYGNNWFTRYPVRLFAALVSGYGLRGVQNESVRNVKLHWIVPVVLVICIMHWLTRGIVPVFIADLVTGLVILQCTIWARLPERLSRMAEFSGRTSFGVFLVHPAFAAGIGVVVQRLFAGPFGVDVFLFHWVLTWLASIILVLMLQRIPWTRMLVN